MKTIGKHINIKSKLFLNAILTMLILFTFFSCSKDDEPEMEASLLAASSQELVLGKWYVNLAQSAIAGHCLKQYYLDFTAGEVKNVGALGFVSEQSMGLGTTIPLTKICELPDETTHGYSWADDENLSVMIDSRAETLSIVLVSKTLLILNNETTGGMLVLKKNL